MSPIKTFTVTNKDTGTRLDVFVTEKLKVSRSQIQKLVEDHQVTLNGNHPSKTGTRLTAGDKIKIAAQTKTKKSAATKSTRKLFTIKDIKIIATTPDYLIVEKPTGMLTHSTEKNEPDSLATLLAKKYPEIKKVGDDPIRPGIVHRLDREASGLLVIARTQKMFDHLKDPFKNRTIEKEYSVLVHGRLSKDWDEINFPIGRSDTADRMAAIPQTVKGLATDDGKVASTEFIIEKRFVNFALLRVTIHTGRMHQIRAHMLAYNHPVVGDPLYYHKKRKPAWDEKCGRLFLHSAKLGFVDLSGEKKVFTSPLPAPLAHFLTIIT